MNEVPRASEEMAGEVREFRVWDNLLYGFGVRGSRGMLPKIGNKVPRASEG